MSNNIEHRAFWEYDGRPYHTIDHVEASFGRKAYSIRKTGVSKTVGVLTDFELRYIQFLNDMRGLDQAFKQQRRHIWLLKILLVSTILFACDPNKSDGFFVGRVIEKEYIGGHMCHSSNYAFSRQLVIMPPVYHAPPPHVHSWQSHEFNIYVASRQEIRHYSLDSVHWATFEPGQKVYYTNTRGLFKAN